MSDNGTLGDIITQPAGTVADTGLIDHSADESVHVPQPPSYPTAEDTPAPAEQPNPMAHWLMIIENVAAGFRHMASMSPMHAPLAGFAAKIEADLAKLRTFL